MICIKRKWKETRAHNMYKGELANVASSFLIRKYCFTFPTINAIFKNVTYFLYVRIFFILFDYEEKG